MTYWAFILGLIIGALSMYGAQWWYATSYHANN